MTGSNDALQRVVSSLKKQIDAIENDDDCFWPACILGTDEAQAIVDALQSATAPIPDALTVLQDAVQYAVNRLDHDPNGPQQPQVSGDLAVALNYSKYLPPQPTTTPIATASPRRLQIADALMAYEQADMGGVFVKVSRQACDEAAALLRAASPSSDSLALVNLIELIKAMDLQATKLTRMEGNEEIVVGYKFNTGCWHRILGTIAGHDTSKWLKTPEGQARVAESAARAKATIDELNEARKIDPKILHEPFSAKPPSSSPVEQPAAPESEAGKAAKHGRYNPLTEEQVEEWRRFLLNEVGVQFGFSAPVGANVLCHMAIDALRADGGTAKDAERYRWLREKMTHERAGPHYGWCISEVIPGDDPDAAIDAAMLEAAPDSQHSEGGGK